MIKVIVFDFDGVIVDSNELKKRAFFDIFSNFNPQAIKVAKNVLSYMTSRTRFEIIKQILIDLSESAEDAIVEDYAKKYNEKVQRGITSAGLKSGVLETFEALSKSYTLYINSGTPEAALKESVGKLGIINFFKNIYGRPMFGEFIAYKEINLKKIMGEEAVGGNEIIMIGDEEGDYQAAKNCNCFFIGVAGNINNREKKDFPIITDFRRIIDTIHIFS